MIRPPVAAVFVLACVVALCAGCGDGSDAPPAAGRYELDRADYAHRLAAEHLLDENGRPRTDVAGAKRSEILAAVEKRAAALELYLELREDGAFMARLVDPQGEQRLGGTWSQDGEVVVFRTTAIPGGRVTTIPDVRARRTGTGLAFDEEVSGFVVPQAFVMRKVD